MLFDRDEGLLLGFGLVDFGCGFILSHVIFKGFDGLFLGHVVRGTGLFGGCSFCGFLRFVFKRGSQGRLRDVVDHMRLVAIGLAGIIFAAGDCGANSCQFGGDAFAACGHGFGEVVGLDFRCLGRCGRGGRSGCSRACLHFDSGLGPIFHLAQHYAVVFHAGFDTAIDLALGDPVQHLCVGGRRFCAKVAVIGRKIAEILSNPAHRRERIVKPLQRAREGAVRYGKYFARSYHHVFAFFSDPASLYLPSNGSEIGTEQRNTRDFFLVRMWSVSISGINHGS